MEKFFKKIILLFFLFFLIKIIPVQAGTIFVSPDRENYNLRENFKIDFVLDTKEENINAVEGKIVLKKDYFKIIQISQENSIISNWIQRPKIVEENHDLEIYFSGIISGGYVGKEAVLLSLILESQKEGKTEINMKEIRTLLNDGKGTEIKSIFLNKNLFFFLKGGSLQEEKEEERNSNNIKDKNAPFSFDLKIARSENIFNNQWFLSFDAKDDKSGIAFYLVQENKFSNPDEEKWEKVEGAPFLLKDQNLRSFIFVEAVDNAGNKKMEVLNPQNFTKERKIDILKETVVLLLFLLIFGLFFLVKFSIKKRKNV